MRAIVAHLIDLPQSVQIADRCVASCARVGIDCTKYPAVPKEKVGAALKDERLEIAQFDTKFSCPEAVLANFVTQYRLWKLVIEQDIPMLLFEHDAVMLAALPEKLEFDHVLQVGQPSFGRFDRKKFPGIYPLFSKKNGYFPGAHAYIVKPSGAEMLVKAARREGAQPCDLFLNSKRFPWLQELYPWVAEAQDSFSTIQKREGCLAKHNFRPGYRHL